MRWHRPTYETDYCLGDVDLASGRVRARAPTNQAKALCYFMRKALPRVTPLNHNLSHDLDGGWIGNIEERHRQRCADIAALLPLRPQDIAHQNRYITKINVYRTGSDTLVTYRAVIRHIVHFSEMAY